jgi:two-component system sensor histidine kinase/response regulator
LRICSQSTATHTTFEFTIEDTGIGIPGDKLSAIFDDFTQAESSITRRFGGIGLGLSISRRIVGLMGGELQVHSELGKGSTFSFSVVLPISFDQQSAKSADLIEITGKKVLIVDNNATNRAILGGMCSAWGMSIVTCGSGPEALESARACPPSAPFALALVDRLMPGMDGFETATQLRAYQPHIAILIISSDSLPGDISRCRELGFCGHLLKPIRSAPLLRQIVKALAKLKGSNIEPNPSGSPSVTPAPNPPDQVAVLAAEDSDDNRFLLEAYCEGTKYRLTFATDGALAVEAYQKDSYDLVLMDIQMPLMDGLTATRTIRAFETTARQKRTPILAMTANALPEDMLAAHEAGCERI